MIFSKMSIFRKPTIQINYNGTKDDLLNNINRIHIALGKENLYKNDINNIKLYVLSDLDFYSLWWRVVVGSISLINDSSPNKNVYYWYKRPKDENPKIYTDFYMMILYSLILITVIVFIFIFVYCYTYDIDVGTYISNTIYL